MTRAFPRPRIVVSRCLGFAACRWNGAQISAPFVQKLADFVEFTTVCPECGVGLGVPRHPIRIVQGEDAPRLVQPATGRDLTAEMRAYVELLLDEAGEPDGFLLKSDSPSCGLRDVKLHRDAESKAPVGRVGGFLGGRVLERFAGTPAEDEGRLTNFVIRDHYLRAVFALAELRRRPAADAGALVDYHATHKYLLLCHGQKAARELGRIVANHEHRSTREVRAAYEALLRQLLSTPPRLTSQIDVLQHLLGYFKTTLNPAEKGYFLDVLEEYRRGGLPLSVPLSLVRSWALRVNNEYLLAQAILSPYPEELVEITDSGKGRDRK